MDMPLKAEDPDAEIPVSDAGLEAILREATGVSGRPLTQKDLCAIGKLVPGDQSLWESVSDLSPLRYCLNMEGIVIDRSQVSDLSPLSGLTKLRGIRIDNSLVSDLSPLAGLSSLTGVEFPRNQIEDISALATLPGLERAELIDNRIADFSPLQDLKNLVALNIQRNGTQDASVLTELAGRLKEKDFDPDQPLEMNPWFFRDPDMIQPENPDEVVVFSDPVFERRVREMLGIPEGGITARDAAGVDGLDFNMEWQENIPDDVRIHDLTGIEYFINIKYLCLNFHAASDIRMLPGLTRVDRVDLGCNGITDLSALASMPNLRYLYLFGNGITDITPLAGLTRLSLLMIEQNRITDVSPLTGMAELAELNLSDNMVADFSPLQDLKNLVALNIQRNGTQDASVLTELAGRLKEKDFDPDQPLEMNPWFFRDPDMIQPENPDEVVVFSDPVFERRVREMLGIPEGGITARDAAGVDGLDFNMEWQENIPDDVRIHDLTGIEYFINIKYLCLNFHAASDIRMLPGLTRVDRVDLGCNGITDLSALASMPNLRYLYLFGNGITDITPLAGLTRLSLLMIEQNRITDVSPLTGMAELAELNLSDNMVADFSPLQGLKNLKMLQIQRNGTQDASVLAELAGRLEQKDFDPNQPLELNPWSGGGPGNNDIKGGDPDMLQPEDPDKVIKFPDKVLERRIREAIGKPEGKITAGDAALVEELFLGNEWQQKFPKGSQIADLSGIEHFINLKRLDISWNRIKDIKKLSGLTRLEYLKAFGNQITSAAPLKDLVNLNSLNIGNNKLTKIDAIKELANLKSLYLDGNKIKDFSPIESIYPWLEDKDFTLGN